MTRPPARRVPPPGGRPAPYESEAGMPHRAKVSFHAPGNRCVPADEVVADDDPILEGRAALFERVGDHAAVSTVSLAKPVRVPVPAPAGPKRRAKGRS